MSIFTSQLLVDIRISCDADQATPSKAMEEFRFASMLDGAQLAACDELPVMVATLILANQSIAVHKALRELAQHFGSELASNPYAGDLIKELCNLNHTFEALELTAYLAKNYGRQLIDNPSIGLAFDGLHRKDITHESDAIKEWLISDQDPEQFPELPKLEELQAELALTGETQVLHLHLN